MEGQLNIDDIRKRKIFESCYDCLCNRCLFYQSGRCPYGGCYDTMRSEKAPYNVVHPDEPPRTTWSNWRTDQGFWCRGGSFYPTAYCEHFVEYTGSECKECLKANVTVFQDGYISCSLIERFGCERCFEEFLEKENEYDGE